MNLRSGALVAVTVSMGVFLACGTTPESEQVPVAGGATSQDFLATELLGRATATSISLHVVPGRDVEMFVEYGLDALDRQTLAATYTAKRPAVVSVDGLSPDSAYRYRLRWRHPGDADFQSGDVHAFHTQRGSGSPFRFTIQADSHLDENSDLATYHQTLANVLDDAPDFHIDLGDTFMCEKHSEAFSELVKACPDRATVDARYLYERGNFGRVAHSVPLFLVNGNHDGELGYLSKGSGDDLAAWATLARHDYFLNPTPDAFFSGDAVSEPFLGERAAWYAWTWGDALFIALDPFWYTTKKAGADAWGWTLGERQYQWLRETLSASRSTYKFVFLHNLVGGLDGAMRGGVEAAPFYEWGGKNADGTEGFAQKRPGWEKPIHSLLVEAKVSAVFHGHDHLYAHQELDGVVYQEVPQPSAKNSGSGSNLAKTYHYNTGTIASSSGHVRVTVGESATVEYVRAWSTTSSEKGRGSNGEVADAYSIVAR